MPHFTLKTLLILKFKEALRVYKNHLLDVPSITPIILLDHIAILYINEQQAGNAI